MYLFQIQKTKTKHLRFEILRILINIYNLYFLHYIFLEPEVKNSKKILVVN